MIFELIMFTAWLCGSALLAIGFFFLLRFLARKIEIFFDKRRRP